MNIAIVDDCRDERLSLMAFINQFYQETPVYKQLSEFSGGETFMDAWIPGRFDLVFLDIFMDGVNGIEVAEKIREADDECLLVFITNSREHAIQSYRLRVFDYLVKPLSYEAFFDSMQHCDKELRRKSRYIEVKESRTLVKIRINDIIFTDYFNHYIQIHTKERMIRSYMRFEDFSPMLLCYPQFLCCYRNCIVNMDHILTLSKNDITMVDGEHMPITRSKRQWIHQQYTDYQFHKLKEQP